MSSEKNEWILTIEGKPPNASANSPVSTTRAKDWIWVERKPKHKVGKFKDKDLGQRKIPEELGSIEFRIGVTPTAENIQKAYNALLPLLSVDENDPEAIKPPRSVKFINAVDVAAGDYEGWLPEKGGKRNRDQRGKEINFYVSWKKNSSNQKYESSLTADQYKKFMLHALKALLDADVDGVAYYPSVAADHSLAPDGQLKSVTYLDYTTSDGSIWKHQAAYEANGFSDPLKNIVITNEDYLAAGITQLQLDKMALKQETYAREHFYQATASLHRELQQLVSSNNPNPFEQFTDTLTALQNGGIDIDILSALDTLTNNAQALGFHPELNVIELMRDFYNKNNQPKLNFTQLKTQCQTKIEKEIKTIEADGNLGEDIKSNQLQTAQAKLRQVKEFPYNVNRLSKERKEAEKMLTTFMKKNSSSFAGLDDIQLSNKGYNIEKIIAMGNTARFLAMEKNIIDVSRASYRQKLINADPELTEQRSGWQKFVDFLYENPIPTFIISIIVTPLLLFTFPVYFLNESSRKPVDDFLAALHVAKQAEGNLEQVNVAEFSDQLSEKTQKIANQIIKLEEIQFNPNPTETDEILPDEVKGGGQFWSSVSGVNVDKEAREKVEQSNATLDVESFSIKKK